MWLDNWEYMHMEHRHTGAVFLQKRDKNVFDLILSGHRNVFDCGTGIAPSAVNQLILQDN